MSPFKFFQLKKRMDFASQSETSLSCWLLVPHGTTKRLLFELRRFLGNDIAGNVWLLYDITTKTRFWKVSFHGLLPRYAIFSRLNHEAASFSLNLQAQKF